MFAITVGCQIQYSQRRSEDTDFHVRYVIAGNIVNRHKIHKLFIYLLEQWSATFNKSTSQIQSHDCDGLQQSTCKTSHIYLSISCSTTADRFSLMAAVHIDSVVVYGSLVKVKFVRNSHSVQIQSYNTPVISNVIIYISKPVDNDCQKFRML